MYSILYYDEYEGRHELVFKSEVIGIDCMRFR